MTQDEMKQAVARAAVDYVRNGLIGVGTGSTANYFIDALAEVKGRFDGAVASSEATAKRLKSHGIPVQDLNSVTELEIYVDGADEITEHFAMIKGGGGALTREKIVAACSKQFICIADESKLVGVLGQFPLPVEVIPMARSYVARERRAPDRRLFPARSGLSAGSFRRRAGRPPRTHRPRSHRGPGSARAGSSRRRRRSRAR